MKTYLRTITFITAALCLFFACAAFASADTGRPASGQAFGDDVTIRVNGRAIDSPYAAYIRKTDGTLYVSVRMIAEALGMKVKWNDENRLPEIVSANSQTFAFPLGKSYFWLNGQRYLLPSGTELESDGSRRGLFVMIPSDDISLLFQAKAKWNENARRLDVSKADGSVSADVSRAFQREWEAWNPGPGDSLELAQALFKSMRVDQTGLVMTVPAKPAGANVYLSNGESEKRLQPGKAYTFPLNMPNANIYASLSGTGGAIREQYRIWLDPGSPNFQLGVFGGQGLDVAAEDIHGNVASLDRIKQVMRNRSKKTNCGTVEWKSAGAAGRLQLYCITPDYGTGDPDHPPVAKPLSALPALSFPIPENQRTQLAAYWMNLNGGGGVNGLLFLGPRTWQVESAGVGADGSAGVTLNNPSDSGEQFNLNMIPGCQGCAVSAIGTYFPSLRQWAKNQTFPGDELDFAKQRPIDAHTIAYTLSTANPGLAVRGVAYERHGRSGGQFAGAAITFRRSTQSLADTILSYASGSMPSWLD